MSLAQRVATEFNTVRAEKADKINNAKLGFDLTNEIVPSAGQLAWNQTAGTLDLGLGDAVLQIGQEMQVPVYANGNITNGQVVMVSGTIANKGTIKVLPHDGTKANGPKILGIATHDMLQTEHGLVTSYGKVRDINTTGSTVGETWVDGDVLYVKPNDTGRLTKVEPIAGQLKMRVGYVVNAHATQGALFIRVSGIDESITNSNVVQVLGESTTDLVSQKAITGIINNLKYNSEIYTGAYGLSWDSSTDTYARTGGTGYVSIQAKMRRCVLNANGTVKYYLHPTNSNFKQDGTASNLTGTDGNVMVEIPKIYCKYENSGVFRNMSISLTADAGYTLHPAFIKGGSEVTFRYYPAYEGFNQSGVLKSISGVTPTRSQTISVFRTQATANGTGWHQIDWNMIFLVQTMAIIEFGTFKTSQVIGYGNHLGNDYGMTTGASNILGNGSTSSQNNDTFMSYRGIENFYGDCWKFVDGINVRERLVYLNGDYRTYASDVFTGGYVSSGITVPVASASYIKDVSLSVKGIIPTVVGGSSNTYVNSGFWSATGDRIGLFGASALNGSLVGSSALILINVSSLSHVELCGGVCF